MPDHLRLPEPRRLDSRRSTNGYDPEAGPIEPDRHVHASTLTGILAGLGFPPPGTPATTPPDDVDEDEDDSRIVLVFTERARLGTGPFRGWKMEPVAEGAGNTFMVISTDESRRLFADLVATYGGNEDDWRDPGSWREQLDRIEGVRIYGPEDRADARLGDLTFAGAETVDVLIWPSTMERRTSRSRIAAARLEEIREITEAANRRNPSLRVVTEDRRPDSTMLRVVVDRDLLQEILNHPVVERVRPPMRPEVSRGDLFGAQAPGQIPQASGDPIGIIDDLVTANPLLDDVVVQRAQFPPDAVFGPATAHGTQVAGVAAYGELRSFIAGSNGLPSPHPIYAARVMHEDPSDPGRAQLTGLFHSQLEAAIVWLHSQGVRIISCSINQDGPDETITPTEAMATIDRLVRELDIVLVLSSGNVKSVDPGHWRDDYPGYLDRDAARVADPAGAALALTVGATSRYDVPATVQPAPVVAVAPAGRAAPFTRTGPTRGRGDAGTLKPEFASHGGNFVWDDQLRSARGKDANMSVITLAPAGSTGGRVFAADDGTSLAAPFVAHQVAEIATRYPGSSANLLRALAALAGDAHAPQRESAAVVSAYGEPNAMRVLESHAHRVVLMYEGEIAVKTNAIHELPVPVEFATGSYGQQIRIAVAFDPPVRRSRRDYLAGSMGFDLVRNRSLEDVARTYAAQPTRTERQARGLDSVELPTGRERPQLEPGSQALASNTLIRRIYRGAWDPDDDGYFVVVKHSARSWSGAAEGPVQRYALAVELSLDARTQIDLYSLIRAQLRARTRLRTA